MNAWLSELQEWQAANSPITPTPQPTKPTKGAFVGSVGCHPGHFQISRQRTGEQEGAGAYVHSVGLIEAINRTCDARGDEPSNRAALIAECLELEPEVQTELRDYFEQEAERWEAANHKPTGSKPDSMKA